MPRYIDADKLWNDRPQFPRGQSRDYDAGFSDCIFRFSTLIHEHINNSTADVVEVVRCKDCRRWTPDGCYGLELDGTKRLYGECSITHMAYKENHYCCFGAKKDT